MATTELVRPIEILLVEDNPADVRLTQEGFKRAKLANNLHTVPNGELAMEFLRRNGDYQESPAPDIILLDLNMPGMDGRDVLREIKDDDDLKTIPVVVLTSSSAEADIIESYEHHANCFISKPVDFQGFVTIIEAIDEFWFSVVVLPKH